MCKQTLYYSCTFPYLPAFHLNKELFRKAHISLFPFPQLLHCHQMSLKMTTPRLPLHLPSNSGCTNLLAYHHHLGKEVTNRWVTRHLLLRPSVQTVYRYKRHKTPAQYYTKSTDKVLFALYSFLKEKWAILWTMWHYQNISLFIQALVPAKHSSTGSTNEMRLGTICLQCLGFFFFFVLLVAQLEITHYNFTFRLNSWKMVV